MLLIFGPGYAGQAVARAARAAGRRVVTVGRGDFATAGAVVAAATHLLSTVPPDAEGDPVLAAHAAAIAASGRLRWAGYVSTTGVYGDRGGFWVTEATPVAPRSDRARRRVAAEAQWAALGGRLAVDLFRTAGIYGPGRSALDGLRAGTARRVVRPGHVFGRIHRDDLARAVLAAAAQDRPAGVRVLHLCDDVPAENAAVVEEAARLLGVAPPQAVPYAQAEVAMSPMARSFWAESRRVSGAATRAMLGIEWLYPSYREGLRAILREQAGDGGAQQGKVGGA